MDTRRKSQTMQAGQPVQGGQAWPRDFPVDNATYNLLQTLTSKLEGIAAYQKFERDFDGQTQRCFREMMKQDQEHCRRLMGMLKERWQIF